MLKIKDNVDLKELEKYGFEFKKYYWCENGIYEKTINQRYDLSIYVDIECREIDEDTVGNGVCDVNVLHIKDLIKAGLVEIEKSTLGRELYLLEYPPEKTLLLELDVVEDGLVEKVD